MKQEQEQETFWHKLFSFLASLFVKLIKSFIQLNFPNTKTTTVLLNFK